MLREAENMTQLSDLLLATLRKRGDWMSRKQIAVEIGRPGQLTPYDVHLLEGLVISGEVIAEQHPTGPVRMTWMYRVKG